MFIAVAFASRPASRIRYSASLGHGGFMDVQFYIVYFTKLTVGQNLCDMKSMVGKKENRNVLLSGRSQSRWLWGLWCWSADTRLLRSQVQNPLKARMFVSFVCCVSCSFSDSADHSFIGVLPVLYVCVCLIVCDLETSKRGGQSPIWAVAPKEKQNILERSSRGLISGNISTFAWSDSITPHKISIRVVTARTDIWIWCPQHKTRKHYRQVNLLSFVRTVHFDINRLVTLLLTLKAFFPVEKRYTAKHCTVLILHKEASYGHQEWFQSQLSWRIFENGHV
jgi:hypothetical protein